MIDSSDKTPLEGIAIVGMAGRFPGATDLDTFWENLKHGVSSIVELSDDELNLSPAEREKLVGNPHFVRRAASVADADKFDAAFFGIYPKEAHVMDPQQRLFLECCWDAFENSGYEPTTYPGSVGVFAGCYMNTYLLNSLEDHPQFIGALADSFHGGELKNELGNDKDYMATRVAFKLNLRGPSMTIQTACSSSLVAVTQACMNLTTYQCDMALAGGATIRFPQNRGYLYEPDGMVSPVGKCCTFDAGAAGTIFGDGIAVVLLKRLEDAVADGDTVYAVIKGWGINNDGASKVGYTAPSVEGQMEAVALAQAVAGVDPRTITYIEAHGTGTPLGDPIEIDALSRAFRMGTDDRQFCAIGSLKTNIGHLDVAAGVAGMIKTSLALTNKQIPPSLNFETPNPNIDFENSPFYVNTALSDWQPVDGAPRRAGLSSFGVGGTNAHVVLEEGPAPRREASRQPQHLITLSARSQPALDAMTANLARYLKHHPELDLADVAYTLQRGRQVFNYSRTLVAATREDAIAQLENPDPQRVYTVHQIRRQVPVSFMFPGQGSQHVGMGQDLYRTAPVFRDAMDRCAELLRPHLGLDLREFLYPSPEHEDAARARINDTMIAQTGIFSVSYAMAQYWMSYGIQPESMIGHSVGEFVAACLAGVFSLEDALALVAARGKLMQDLPSGSMLAVRLPVDEVRALLPDDLEIAAINSPALCVVSGPTLSIGAFEKALEEREISVRPLHTSHAFHSAMMEPAVPAFRAALSGMTLHAPQIPVISTVTGERLTPELATDVEYWATHLRRTVDFAGGVRALVGDANRVLLEVGPGQTLSTLARQHPERKEKQVILSSLPHVQQEVSAAAFALGVVGRLWQGGVDIDWKACYPDEFRLRVPLPSYPFERKRFWYDQVSSSAEDEDVTNTETTPAHLAAAPAPASSLSNGYAPDAHAGDGSPHAVPDEMIRRIVAQQIEVMARQLQAWHSQ
ncbi:MAG: type I polyketide synthase [Rhodothermales bacterium]